MLPIAITLTMLGMIVGYSIRAIQQQRRTNELLADHEHHIEHLARELKAKRKAHVEALQDIRDMQSDAELGAKVRRQRKAALDKANAANRRRHAEKIGLKAVA